LRERASVRGKQKTWVSECSDEQLFQIFQKLQAGETARAIAHYVQTAWNMSSDADIHSVSQGILKFRKRIEDLLEIQVPDIPSPSVQESIEEIQDDLLAMDRVVRSQRERIERMMAEEKERGVRYTNLSRDLQSLSTLSKVLVKEKEFALRHAGEDPIRRRQEELRDQRMERNFNTMMEYLGPDGQDRIVETADRFLQLVAEKAARLVRSEDENGNPVYCLPRDEEG